MPSLYPAPTEQDVEAFLAALLSGAAHVARAQSAEPDREPTGVMIEYVTDDDAIAAIAFADHGAVNFLGGAIGAIEAATVQETDT